jgi:hypothetical protein
MKVIQATIALLLLFMAVTAAVPTSTPPTGASSATMQLPGSSNLPDQALIGPTATVPAAEQGASGTSPAVFLPMVVTDYPRCSVDSPFGIQIAALHQVTPGQEQASYPQTLTEAERLTLNAEGFPTLPAALKASGACWARVLINWGWIQPDPPPSDYVWGPYHDEKLRLVAETGVHLVAIVDKVPAWALYSNQGVIHPDRLDEFAQFLTDLVNRYKQPPYNIHHWELFNEPDIKLSWGWGLNGDRYAEMLAVAYPAIKAADPEATVLMGGLAHEQFLEVGGMFNRYFADEVMATLDQHDSDALDGLNIHYFPDFHWEWERWDPNSPERRAGWLPAPTCGDVFDGEGTVYEAGGIDVIAKVTHFRNRMRSCSGVDKPVWITEIGRHGAAGSEDWSLAKQARYVIQGNARGLAAGVQHIIWYVLVDPPYESGSLGLLYEDDWSPKPAFFAYQTLTSELAGYRYAYTLDVQGVEGYVFRDSSQRKKTVAWGMVADGNDTIPLAFAPASGLRVADCQGSVTYLEDGGAGDEDGERNGTVVLGVTGEPVFVSQY